MTIVCSKCNKEAITYIRYNGTHLCSEHFISYFEKRVKKNIKKQGRTPDGAKIAVALSGGKDSTVVLHIAHDVYSKRKNVELITITVDEGIQGYRDKSIKIAEKNCKKLGVEQKIVSFKKLIGVTMDEISQGDYDIGQCSFCGVFRRFCLNKVAKELKVDRLITGHNLDDMSQSILMNFVNGDIEKLARLAPHIKIKTGLVPRMVPLSVIPEKENALYAYVKNIEFYDGECPYSHVARRGVFQDIIYDLEEKKPGTRHSILTSYEKIRDLLMIKYPPVELTRCEKCGEPSSQRICKTCALREMVSKKLKK